MSSKPAANRRTPAGAKQPKDHQRKRPRVRPVTVPMDPQAVIDVDEARQRLEARRQELAQDRDVRAARLLADRRGMGGTSAGHEMSLDIVRAEVDVAIADELAPLEKAVQEALQRVDDTSRTYVFHALGNVTFQKLLGAHKATDDDHEKVKEEGIGQRALFHAETFGPALVEKCCDELDEAEVADMFGGEDWNLAELQQLFMAAYEVNTQRSVVAR